MTVTYFDQHHIPPLHAPCRTHAAAIFVEDVYQAVSSASSRDVVSSPHQHTAAEHLQKTSCDGWTQNRKFQQSVTHTFGHSQSWKEFHRRREFQPSQYRNEWNPIQSSSNVLKNTSELLEWCRQKGQFMVVNFLMVFESKHSVFSF